jgi:hypothetical protein
MSECIPFDVMVLQLMGEHPVHLLPPSTLNRRYIAPQDRGDADPSLLAMQHAPLWAAPAGDGLS